MVYSRNHTSVVRPEEKVCKLWVFCPNERFLRLWTLLSKYGLESPQTISVSYLTKILRCALQSMHYWTSSYLALFKNVYYKKCWICYKPVHDFQPKFSEWESSDLNHRSSPHISSYNDVYHKPCAYTRDFLYRMYPTDDRFHNTRQEK